MVDNKIDKPASPYYMGDGPKTEKDIINGDESLTSTDYLNSSEVREFVDGQSDDDLPFGPESSSVEEAESEISDYFKGKGPRIEGDNTDFDPEDLNNPEVRRAMENGELSSFSQPDQKFDSLEKQETKTSSVKSGEFYLTNDGSKVPVSEIDKKIDNADAYKAAIEVFIENNVVLDESGSPVFFV